MTSPSPDNPNDPLAPFRSIDAWSAIRLERDVAAGGHRRMQGFLQAARLLLRTAAETEDWVERDPLIWPALYSFRHYVELGLKALASEGAALGLAQPGNTHRLDRLWPPVREGISRTLGQRGRPIDTIEQAIAVLTALDPGGDGLRYATLRNGAPSIALDIYLEPLPLLYLVDAVADVFSAAELAMDAAIDRLREDWEART